MFSPDSSKNDWYIKSPQSMYGNPYWDSQISRENEDEIKQTEWQCGDTKKLKRLMTRFAQTSSLHGAPYVCSSKRANKYLNVLYRYVKKKFLNHCECIYSTKRTRCNFSSTF